jgi:hypothetical protein
MDMIFPFNTEGVNHIACWWGDNLLQKVVEYSKPSQVNNIEDHTPLLTPFYLSLDPAVSFFTRNNNKLKFNPFIKIDAVIGGDSAVFSVLNFANVIQVSFAFLLNCHIQSLQHRETLLL